MEDIYKIRAWLFTVLHCNLNDEISITIDKYHLNKLVDALNELIEYKEIERDIEDDRK